MEAATKPNNTNLFPNSLTLHIYKSILLFIKGELASKPQNIKEFKSILGLQKSPVCPICVTIVSGISLNL